MSPFDGFVRQKCSRCGYVSPAMSSHSPSVQMAMCLNCWSFGTMAFPWIMETGHKTESVMQSELSADEAITSDSEANR